MPCRYVRATGLIVAAGLAVLQLVVGSPALRFSAAAMRHAVFRRAIVQSAAQRRVAQHTYGFALH